MFAKSHGSLLLLILLAGMSQLALAAKPAAEVLHVRGSATATSLKDEVRELSKGDEVFPGDRLKTGVRSSLRLKFTDQSRFSLGANSSMQIDLYIYEPAKEDNGMSARVIKGAFRMVTGLIAKAKPERVRVQTPVASVGIRGTDFVGQVEETSAQIILLEPEVGEDAGAIEVSNEFGSVIIDEGGFGTEIPDQNSPPSPPRRMSLRMINNLMRNLQFLGRIGPRTP